MTTTAQRAATSSVEPAPDENQECEFVPLALPIDRAAVAAGVTRTRIYGAVKSEELTARKAGKETIVEVPELRRWIRSLPFRGRRPEADAIPA